MKSIIAIICCLFVLGVQAQQQSFFALKAKTIEGESFSFEQLKGKKIMIVNTASECGYTPQYADLEKLFEQYKDKGLIIIGFPSNDFGAQEPGSNAEIKGFCQKNYGVSFQMMEKVSTKGDEQHPVYQWLTQKALNGKQDSQVKWNFQKYLISENGELIDVLPSKELPGSERVTNWLDAR